MAGITLVVTAVALVSIQGPIIIYTSSWTRAAAMAPAANHSRVVPQPLLQMYHGHQEKPAAAAVSSQSDWYRLVEHPAAAAASGLTQLAAALWTPWPDKEPASGVFSHATPAPFADDLRL